MLARIVVATFVPGHRLLQRTPAAPFQPAHLLAAVLRLEEALDATFGRVIGATLEAYTASTAGTGAARASA